MLRLKYFFDNLVQNGGLKLAWISPLWCEGGGGLLKYKLSQFNLFIF